MTAQPRPTPAAPAETVGVVARPARRLKADATESFTAQLVEEVPVALVYNGISHAVMLASPVDIADFALGFSLSEGIIAGPDELLELEVAPAGEGIEVRLTITARRFAGLKDRRRTLAGRSGCGLCGVESMADALRPLPPLEARSYLTLAAIHRALDGLAPLQRLNHLAGAVHAAAWADPDGTIRHLAEDVGRHNAFDKVIGHMARRDGGQPGGFAVLTSRLSYELVQKAATTGISALVAISAPTALAVDAAERAGICVVALARADSVTVYTHPDRIIDLDKGLPMHSDRLIRMANQIAAYFSAYPHDEAVAGVSDHLRHFWEPRMLNAIKEIVAHGGGDLHALVPEAVRKLS